MTIVWDDLAIEGDKRSYGRPVGSGIVTRSLSVKDGRTPKRVLIPLRGRRLFHPTIYQALIGRNPFIDGLVYLTRRSFIDVLLELSNLGLVELKVL